MIFIMIYHVDASADVYVECIVYFTLYRGLLCNIVFFKVILLRFFDITLAYNVGIEIL